MSSLNASRLLIENKTTTPSLRIQIHLINNLYEFIDCSSQDYFYQLMAH